MGLLTSGNGVHKFLLLVTLTSSCLSQRASLVSTAHVQLTYPVCGRLGGPAAGFRPDCVPQLLRNHLRNITSVTLPVSLNSSSVIFRWNNTSVSGCHPPCLMCSFRFFLNQFKSAILTCLSSVYTPFDKQNICMWWWINSAELMLTAGLLWCVHGAVSSAVK